MTLTILLTYPQLLQKIRKSSPKTMYVEVSINVPKENIIVFEYAINELRKMKEIYAMYHNNVNHPLHNDIKSFCWPVPLNVES